MTTIPLTLQLDSQGPLRGGVFANLNLSILDRGHQVTLVLDSIGRRIGDLTVDKADLIRLFGALGEHALERS